MKKYDTPEISVTILNEEDIITTSPGVETPWYEESDGIWDFSL